MGSDLTSLLRTDTDGWWVDRMYLRDAFQEARFSLDPSTQVGAVFVVPSGAGVVLRDHNGVPSRLRGAGYPLNENDKNYCTEHAERRLLFKSIQNRIPSEPLTMYCTWASCAECARTMIQFGVSKVVTFSALVEKTPDRWSDSIRNGIRMLTDCGIPVVGWRGDLGVHDYILFDRQRIGNEDLK